MTEGKTPLTDAARAGWRQVRDLRDAAEREWDSISGPGMTPAQAERKEEAEMARAALREAMENLEAAEEHLYQVETIKG